MAERLAVGAPTGLAVRIRPGESDAIEAGLNPLEPASTPRATGSRCRPTRFRRGAMHRAVRCAGPAAQVLGAALRRAYEEAGWDLALGSPWLRTRTPGIRPSLIAAGAEQLRREAGYGSAVPMTCSASRGPAGRATARHGRRSSRAATDSIRRALQARRA